MSEADVRKLVQAAIDKAPSLRHLAKEWGITPSYLCDIRLGRRAPGPPVLDALGLERTVVVTYRKRKPH